MIPAHLLEQTPETILEALRFPTKAQSYQDRSDQEWANLIQAEHDPIQGALLMMDWIEDRGQALTELDGVTEVHQAHQSLTE